MSVSIRPSSSGSGLSRSGWGVSSRHVPDSPTPTAAAPCPRPSSPSSSSAPFQPSAEALRITFQLERDMWENFMKDVAMAKAATQPIRFRPEMYTQKLKKNISKKHY